MHTTHLRTIIFVVGVLFGVTIGYTSSSASEIALMTALLICAQAVLYIIGRWRGVKSTLPVLVMLGMFGVVLGIVRVQVETERATFVCAACTVGGEVLRAPEMKETYQQFVFEIHQEASAKEMYRAVLVRVPLYPEFTIGESLELRGKIVEPSTIFPHENRKTFDYKSYLHVHGIGSEMWYPEVLVTDTEAHTLPALLGRVKESFVKRIEMYIRTPESSLASGMLFGTDGMSQEAREDFRISGLSHIVVLSGFNIAILISFVLVLFRFVPLVLRVLSATGLVLLFVIMVGGEASVIRATIMALIALSATALGRAYVAQQALLISLCAIVIYEPSGLMHDVSLHLSFLATAGIVYLVPTISAFFKKYIRVASLLEIFSTTLAAYLATLPYIMYTFGTASLYALVANVLVLPLIPLAMLLTASVLFCAYISSGLSLVIGFMTTYLLSYVLSVAALVSSLPHAQLKITVSFAYMVSMYVVLGVIFLIVALRRSNETNETIKQVSVDTFSY